jgi:hypothetical protein
MSEARSSIAVSKSVLLMLDRLAYDKWHTGIILYQ